MSIRTTALALIAAITAALSAPAQAQGVGSFFADGRTASPELADPFDGFTSVDATVSCCALQDGDDLVLTIEGAEGVEAVAWRDGEVMVIELQGGDELSLTVAAHGSEEETTFEAEGALGDAELTLLGWEPDGEVRGSFRLELESERGEMLRFTLEDVAAW